MQFKNIEILAMQETHIGDEIKEDFKTSKYTWYFSGGGTEAKKIAQGDAPLGHQGVAIVMKNELRNYIKDIDTIDERFISITLRGKST